MELLSMVLSKTTSENPTFAYHWRCHQTKTTHLCFTDDLMLFCGHYTSCTSSQGSFVNFLRIIGLDPKLGQK